MQIKDLLYMATIAAVGAGHEILKYYEKYKSWKKEDNSPLTSADLAANDKIFEILNATGIEICSEEKIIPFDKRKNLNEFWVVDPLDGTKEFIKKNGEFCVCIALLQNLKPVLGVIFSPIKQEIIYGANEVGIFFEKVSYDFKPKFLPLIQEKTENFKIFLSQNIDLNAKKLLLEKFKCSFVSLSSALKFIKMCKNEVQIYARFKGSYWWDICAGDALLKICGGKIIDLDTKKEICYNGKNLKNANFIAVTQNETLNKILWDNIDEFCKISHFNN